MTKKKTTKVESSTKPCGEMKPCREAKPCRDTKSTAGKRETAKAKKGSPVRRPPESIQDIPVERLRLAVRELWDFCYDGGPEGPRPYKPLPGQRTVTFLRDLMGKLDLVPEKSPAS